MRVYEKYARDVIKHPEKHGELIRLSCERFLADIKRKDLDFRHNEVERAIKFISAFNHYVGAHNGKSFELEPWQQFVVANVVGFYWHGRERRRFTNSYIQIARKNGKTMFAAALCMYFFVADGEGGAEVLLAANSKDQAKIAFDMCRELSRQINSEAGELLKIRHGDVLFEATNSRLKVLAADDTKLDGFNASFALLDEFHAASNSKVYEVLASSQGMRTRPHLMVITTAGFNKLGPCYQMRKTIIDVLKGNKTDDSAFAAIYELDAGDDWREQSNWRKANPNYGVTVLPEYIREQVNKARNDASLEVGVLTKTLNVWCEASQVWIADDVISNIMRPVEWEEYTKRVCVCGVDLGSVSDLTALSVMMEGKDGKLVFKTEYYLPESCLERGPNCDNYRLWHQQGWLTVTPGNVTDYDAVTMRLKEIWETCYLDDIGYDKWNAVQWAIDATAEGLPLRPFSQSIGNFNAPTKELQRRILGGLVEIDYNPITAFCFQNVVIKTDFNGNEKPAKDNYSLKIDGVIAMIQALGMRKDIFEDDRSVVIS